MSQHARTAVAILASSALALSVAGMASAETLTSAGKPVTNAAGQTFKVVAHRGGALQWPENSVAAFTGAAEAGYDAIETDVSFTSDGVAVMSHYDKLPSRCTSAGSRIHKMTWAQVKTVRCADLSATKAKTVPIPTFAELAAILTAHSGVGLTLDIKSYSQQSTASKKLYATRAVKLVKKYGLLSRTRFLTFYWDAALPAIRALAPKAFVLAYDNHGFSYDRVRLAAKLGASGYGTKSQYTSVNLATFIRAKGMDMSPWNITTTQGQAMSIAYGPKTIWLITNSPAALTTSLTSGTAKLNWTAADKVTTLTKPVTVSKATYAAQRNRYPKVLGTAVPSAKLLALKTVTISITVTKGPQKNYVYTAARSADASSTKKLALPSGTATVRASVPVGNDGKLRIRTTKKSKLTIKVLGYTNEVYTETSTTTINR